MENRRTDVLGLDLPTWKDVVARNYHPWHQAFIIIDTAGQTPEESKTALIEALNLDIESRQDANDE